MAILSDHQTVAQRILDHVRHGTTDLSSDVWREPVAHYRSTDRFATEVEGVLRRHPTPFCPSSALPDAGSFVARDAAATPIVAVRGGDGQVRAFRNSCRHRGAQLVDGSGCARAFVCPYHSWSYRLDGRLRHVPHARGFGDIVPEDHGLVPVACWERHGLVLVTQDGAATPDGAFEEVAGLIGPGHRLLAGTKREEATNWKVLAETFLEGYHIRFTHRDTFYPVQFDNLNLVEEFGPNSRVTFPFRTIAKLASIAPGDRTIDGRLTFVYHLFPNVMIATFPEMTLVIVLEPTAVDRTTVITYALADGVRHTRAPGSSTGAPQVDLLTSGADEDFAVARAVQRGLGSGANDHLTFGRFEGAIGHFHRTLDAALDSAIDRQLNGDPP